MDSTKLPSPILHKGRSVLDFDVEDLPIYAIKKPTDPVGMEYGTYVIFYEERLWSDN